MERKIRNIYRKISELAEEFKLAISGKLPENYKDELPKFSSDHNAATRADSEKSFKQLVNLFLHSLVVLQI